MPAIPQVPAGTGMFGDDHIALRVRPSEVCGIRALFGLQCVAEVTHPGLNPGDPEYN